MDDFGPGSPARPLQRGTYTPQICAGFGHPSRAAEPRMASRPPGFGLSRPSATGSTPAPSCVHRGVAAGTQSALILRSAGVHRGKCLWCGPNTIPVAISLSVVVSSRFGPGRSPGTALTRARPDRARSTSIIRRGGYPADPHATESSRGAGIARRDGASAPTRTPLRPGGPPGSPGGTGHLRRPAHHRFRAGWPGSHGPAATRRAVSDRPGSLGDAATRPPARRPRESGCR